MSAKWIGFIPKLRLTIWEGPYPGEVPLGASDASPDDSAFSAAIGGEFSVKVRKHVYRFSRDTTLSELFNALREHGR
jgi:hypothetical protein